MRGPSMVCRAMPRGIVSIILLQALISVDSFTVSRPSLGLRPAGLSGVAANPHRTTARRSGLALPHKAGSQWSAALKFYQAADLQINWRQPQAKGNFGSVYYGKVDGQECVVKCPVTGEFSLKLFDTERAVNIKLNKASGDLNVPWAQMLGEVNIPESIEMPGDVARIGIVWKKEGDGSTLEDYLQSGKDLYRALRVSPENDKRTKLARDLSLKVMAEMLQGLILMQEKGIMHRDIKPSNTVVTPNDPKHQIKIIDFGSCCDWSDPLKMGLMDATNDPMYCAPEQTLNFVGPGKFDVFSVGMTGLRCLFPAFQRGTASTEWPGGRFQYFAEREFPKSGYSLEAWLKERAVDESEPALAVQCRELLEDKEMQQIRMLLQSILVKNVIGRPSAQDCLKKVGGSFAAQAQQELQETKSAENEVKRIAAETTKTGQIKEREEEASFKQADQEEESRLKLGAQLALSAASNFISVQKQVRGSAEVKKKYGIDTDKMSSGRSDKDIANIVPDEWRDGVDFYRSQRLSFTKGEIVVTFRSDGSRRFGKIIQDYGEGTYDILVDLAGGEGEGQYRTERQQSIGKIATGRTLKEEEAASQDQVVRSLKKQRREFVRSQAKLGNKIPQEWQMNVDVAFGPTTYFKANEIVAVARTDGSLRFGKVRKINGDGTLEIQVDVTAKRLYFVGSIGKILI